MRIVSKSMSFIAIPLTCLVLIASKDQKELDAYNPSEAIGCAPPTTSLTPIIFSEGRNIGPLPGTGNHAWTIKTTSDSAQFYFNQGLNLFYSFHVQESQSSFLEAIRHDSSCVMAYWGWAMTEGPTINSPNYNSRPSKLLAGLGKAKQLQAEGVEQELLSTQLQRFTADRDPELKERNITYRDALKALYEKYPDHREIPVLYADALMHINARNWYELNGEPKAGTTEIITLLESIIQKQTNHPAALHYYIHMVEPSNDPQRALEEADRLLELLPSVAHMVHMPSHIYIRSGHYEKGITSNIKAIAGYKAFQSTMSNWQGNKSLYFTHNADMQGANASLMGNYTLAREAYLQNMQLPKGVDNELQPQAGYLPFHGAQLYLLDVRFGKWDKVLQVKEPASRNVYQHILWLFGQGMAKAKKGDVDGAMQSLKSLKAEMSESSLQRRNGNRNRNIDGANIASKLLEGTIEQVRKNHQSAITLFNNAVILEDSLRYSEPEDWRIPARQLLAQAYLQQENYDMAEQVLKSDLLDHPANFWALNGLYYILLQQGKNELAEKFRAQYASAFKAADVKVEGAAF